MFGQCSRTLCYGGSMTIKKYFPTVLLAALIATSLSSPVEAKWFLFGKEDQEPRADRRQVAAAGSQGMVVKQQKQVVVPAQNIDEDGYMQDMLGNTLTMPMNVLQPLKGTQKGLESLQKPIKELKEPLTNLEPPLKKLDSSIDSLKTPLKELESPLTTLTETTGDLKAPIKSVGANISELKQPINQLKSPISDLKKPIADLGQPVKDLNVPIKGLQKPIGDLNQPLQDVADSLNAVRDEIFSLRTEIQGIEATAERIVFYILIMVSVLCVTAIFILYGVFRFLNLRQKNKAP